MTEILTLIMDGVFAAIAAIGFGAISNPPRRAFGRIALMAAVGHCLRTFLMANMDVNIAFASFFAALLIGLTSVWLGRGIKVPMTCLIIPSLLPMIPGIYAYKSVFSLIMFLQNLDSETESARYMSAFFLNATVSVGVVVLLVVGAVIPLFIFRKRSFAVTR